MYTQFFQRLIIEFYTPVNQGNLFFTFGVLAALLWSSLTIWRLSKRVKIIRTYTRVFDMDEAKRVILAEMRGKGCSGNVDFEIKVCGGEQVEEYEKIVLIARGVIERTNAAPANELSHQEDKPTNESIYRIDSKKHRPAA